MKTFLNNLKIILVNLPLILSDSYAGKDVSYIRFVGIILFIFLLLLIIVLYITSIKLNNTQLVKDFVPYFQALTTLLGVNILANIAKKGIKAYENKNSEGNKNEGN